MNTQTRILPCATYTTLLSILLKMTLLKQSYTSLFDFLFSIPTLTYSSTSLGKKSKLSMKKSDKSNCISKISAAFNRNSCYSNLHTFKGH